MPHHELKSNAELSLFIESYWHFYSEATSPLILFPDGTFNVIFAFSSFYSHTERRTYRPGVYLCPIRKYPIELHASSGVYGIRFKAFSLINVIGQSSRDLTLLNDMRHFIARSPSLAQLEAHYLSNGHPDECFSLLEQVSFDLLERNLNIHHSLRDKVNYILDKRGNIRVEDMAEDFGVSRQALHKHFKKHLHITPKELAAIWQLNHFFTLRDFEEESLTGLALDAGYYDQAHFINSFKLQFGTSPTKFIKANPELFTLAREIMSRRFNNYYDPEIST